MGYSVEQNAFINDVIKDIGGKNFYNFLVEINKNKMWYNDMVTVYLPNFSDNKETIFVGISYDTFKNVRVELSNETFLNALNKMKDLYLENYPDKKEIINNLINEIKL